MQKSVADEKRNLDHHYSTTQIIISYSLLMFGIVTISSAVTFIVYFGLL